MAKEYSRTQRIADQMQRELAKLIQFQIKDPRMGMVTVSYIKVAKDLGYADVYVTVLPLNGKSEEEATKASLSILNQAAGFLRGEIARSIKLRVVPQLRFHFDGTVERGRSLHSLIEKAYQFEAEKSGKSDKSGE